MDALYVFFATYITVFALGFQSRNVNTHQYWAAAFTSVAIGLTHLVLYRILPEGNTSTMVAFIVAGPLAITSSMYAHARWMMPTIIINDDEPEELNTEEDSKSEQILSGNQSANDYAGGGNE